MANHYQRPPIVEAVIEFQLASSLSPQDLKTLRSYLLDQFPTEEEISTFSFHLDFDTGRATVKTDALGFKLTSIDGSAVRVIRNAALAFSSVGLYGGWENFSGSVRHDMDEYVRQVKRKIAISRVGVRYINRIDIPYAAGGKYETGDYVTYNLQTPASMGSTTQVAIQARHSIGEADHCEVIVNSTTAPSPLINHSSIIVDLDIVKIGDVPAPGDQLWELVQRMRGYKNDVFEAAITDKTRELIGSD